MKKTPSFVRVLKSRKRRSRRLGGGRLDVVDAVNERFERMATLAGLLYACVESPSLDARLAAHAGHFMEVELCQVRALLDGFLKEGR